MMEFIATLGSNSITSIWIPIGLWTVIAIPLFLLSRYPGSRHPAMHYHGALALLLSLPLGFALMPLITANVAIFSVQDALLPSAWFAPEFAETHTEAMDGSRFASASPSSRLEGVASESPEEAMLDSSRLSERVSPAPSMASAYSPVSVRLIAGWITLLAGCVSFGSLLLLLVNMIRLVQFSRRLIPVDDEWVLNQLRILKEKFGVRRGVRLMVLPDELGPMTFGVLRPVIGIPRHLLDQQDALSSVLYHELIHIRRFDYLTGWLTKATRAVFVFHPGVHLLARQIDTYREISCDAEFLSRSRVPPSDYARLLLRFSTRNQAHYAVSMVHQSSTLKKRIQHMSLQRFHSSFSNKTLVAAVSVLLLLPALLVACSSDAPPSQESELVLLEAQVSYLHAEILNIAREKQALQETYEGINADSPEWNVYFAQNNHLNNRSGLVNELLGERMRALEYARMEVATSAMLKQVKN